MDTRNGVFTYSYNTTYRAQQGTVIHVQCNPGKTLVQGVSSATCSSDGTWFPTIPGCGGKDTLWLDIRRDIRQDTRRDIRLDTRRDTRRDIRLDIRQDIRRNIRLHEY